MTQNLVLTHRHERVELELHAYKAVWHAASRNLFVADLHLGKENAFQRNGIAVPAGSTADCLCRLKRLLARYHPDRVVILGDMIHAISSFSSVFYEQMEKFWSEHTGDSQPEWLLVEGNHDRRARRELSKWPISLVEPALYLGDIVCLHDPADANELTKASDSEPALVLAGHLHPAYRMPDNGEKLSCFIAKENLLIFPAFNEFTGRTVVEIQDAQSVYVVRNEQLAKIQLGQREKGRQQD